MNIQIVSGFLGSGKTTFLNRYMTCLQGRVAVIENEFGPAGLDAQLLGEEVPVKEISAGCICCSMAMDFQQGIAEVEQKYHPDYLLIEPSGVGRLSDVVKACTDQGYSVDQLITMVDLSSYEDYAQAFGEFYLDQIRGANLLSGFAWHKAGRGFAKTARTKSAGVAVRGRLAHDGPGSFAGVS